MEWGGVHRLLPVSRLGDEPAAGFHLHVETPLHTAHLHVLMQVSVHVILGCGQFQLEREQGSKNPFLGAKRILWHLFLPLRGVTIEWARMDKYGLSRTAASRGWGELSSHEPKKG